MNAPRDDEDHQNHEDHERARASSPSDRTSDPLSPRARRGEAAQASLVAIVVTVTTAAAVGYAFRPVHAGHPLMLAILAFCYGSLGLATLVWLHRRGVLKERLAPRPGDISFGFLLAAALYLVATLGSKALAPAGSEEEAWLARVYLQLGDPRTTASFAVGIAVLCIAAAEEVSWRGLVLDNLVTAFGGRIGWLVTTGLYTLVHLPTMFLLADPRAGLNPLLMVAAAGCGLVWGYLAMKIERLGPSLFSHALFTWAVVEFPLWRM